MKSRVECPHWSYDEVGSESTGELIVKCSDCGEIWNEGA